VFHVSLLEPADSKTPIQEDWKYKAETEEYKVKKILEQKGQNYLIKWNNYEELEST